MWIFFQEPVLARTARALGSTTLAKRYQIGLEGGVYISLLSRRETDGTTRVINVERIKNTARVVWVLWGVYVVISECFVLRVRFASNIWFSRAIHVDGPYMLAELVVSVLLPFVTVFIPLYFTRVRRLVEILGVSE